MKKNILVPCLALAMLFAACNSAETNDNNTDSMGLNTDTDTTAGLFNKESDAAEFLKDAAAGGMMEVQLGELAKKNASSKAVKDFGDMMVKDHSDANAELKNLAAQKNVELPATLPEDKQEKVDDFSKKSPNDFDKDYMSLMVDDHEEDIDEFEKMANNADSDAEVKAFAAKVLPTLRKHLEAAKKIKDQQK